VGGGLNQKLRWISDRGEASEASRATRAPAEWIACRSFQSATPPGLAPGLELEF